MFEDIKKPMVIMAVGLPGSGKSTFAELLDEDFVRLSSDKYIENLCRSKKVSYNDGHQEFIELAETMLKEERAASVQFGRSIYYDQTNLTIKSRKRKLANFPKTYKKVAIIFKRSEEYLNEVNEKRRPLGRHLRFNRLKEMILSYQEPTAKEGFDKIYIYNENNELTMVYSNEPKN